MPEPEPRCALTELLVSACAHCREEQEMAKSEPLHWFTALYAGRCFDCAREFGPGDKIAATEDGYVCCERCHDA